MASVSSLDQDMRKLRLDRYTPGAANEIRGWIENTLGERLAPGDLMEALRDGVALCKLINLAVSPNIKYKASNMPFVQMENISHFLKACEMPPLNLPAHDRFLTVDLYDKKDPAQVLQCIAAFSRRANQVNPTNFPTTIGAKSKGGALSPESTGPGSSPYSPKVVGYTTNAPKTKTSPATTFNPLNKAAYASSGRTSPTKSASLSRGGLATGGSISSWSTESDRNNTAPAWNTVQYGSFAGPDQGKLGVVYGGRRQITSTAPEVPSLVEKEKRLREKLEQEKQQLRDNEARLRAQQEAEEAQAKEEEERKWQEETNRLRREEELAQQQEESRGLREEQARKDQEAEERLSASRNRQRTTSDARLNGQFLSQYHATQKPQPALPKRLEPQLSAEQRRIADLERELEGLRQQQATTTHERRPQEHISLDPSTVKVDDEPDPQQRPALPTRPSNNVQTAHEDDWDASERDYLRNAHKEYSSIAAEHSLPPKPPRPQPAEPARPLPDPSTYAPNTTRTSRFLTTNPAPAPTQASQHTPNEASHGTTAEIDAENARRLASQHSTRAGGWASKSLLEREMERERERQREWEESQKQTQTAARDIQEGSAPGQTWDVHQYGYIGGDSQNRGGPGLGASGARRQIIGPRPPR
ncbi:calponin [Lithohypha guttulata]|uniref:calponin n=1 Tax=Lithohypha guttulata TaxID=1690604 RepID=UPI002DDEFEF3|nr:calponin [Lithohypha guttulata]